MEVVSGTSKKGFLIQNSGIRNEILVPRYYDPEIGRLLKDLSKTHELPTIGSLIEEKVLQVRQGKEIGKL